MKIQSRMLGLILGLLLSLNSVVASTPQNDKVIIPGERIGNIRIGMPEDEVYKSIGKPQDAEAAMGTAAETWVLPGGAKLSLILKRDDEGRRFYVKQIRIDSPDYVVSGAKVNVASPMHEIWKAFPETAYQSTKPSDPRRPVEIYSDMKRGIAFEILRESQKSGDWGRCQAIIVHVPGNRAW